MDHIRWKHHVEYVTSLIDVIVSTANLAMSAEGRLEMIRKICDTQRQMVNMSDAELADFTKKRRH